MYLRRSRGSMHAIVFPTDIDVKSSPDKLKNWNAGPILTGGGSCATHLGPARLLPVRILYPIHKMLVAGDFNAQHQKRGYQKMNTFTEYHGSRLVRLPEVSRRVVSTLRSAGDCLTAQAAARFLEVDETAPTPDKHLLNLWAARERLHNTYKLNRRRHKDLIRLRNKTAQACRQPQAMIDISRHHGQMQKAEHHAQDTTIATDLTLEELEEAAAEAFFPLPTNLQPGPHLYEARSSRKGT
ncbi:hypothetical protein HPB49_016973 [Dermacentor silvarum]|uniref:Uncharacterized protein n=1 Tax=Dermacentor silvarum TaxID=543639 RepID=A0ACB8E1L9_DERSI|nr:hypothetical protein HPB49_016973 [Dermacentor silvarum]